MKKVSVALPLIALLFLGAGCTSGKTADSTQLRQPSAPSAPTKAPEIPSEAKNIPRPY
ncbi:MAG: hypothetical protein NUV81_01970 [bacterium]|nr:hypothetical protein [bacterium]